MITTVLRRLGLALLLAAAAGLALAQDLVAVPALSARVIDETGTLSTEQRRALSDKLQAIEAQHRGHFEAGLSKLTAGGVEICASFCTVKLGLIW